MLAELVVRSETSSAFTFVNDDIRDAFGQLPVRRIAEALADWCVEPRLIELIIQLVTAGRPNRELGIIQGSELSPTLMNLLLHETLDVPFRNREPRHPLYRYADNLAAVGAGRREAERCRDIMVELLAAVGLRLKGTNQPEGGIFDLTRQPTTLLGFRLVHQEGRLVFQLSEPAETLVRNNLEELIRIEDRPDECVKDHLLGWIGSLGPAYQDTEVETVCATALSEAVSFGFRDIVSAEELQENWRRAHQRWLTHLAHARSRITPQTVQG